MWHQSVFLLLSAVLVGLKWSCGASKQGTLGSRDRGGAQIIGTKSEVLCAVVYGSSQDAARVLDINLNSTKGLCDWAIIAYSGLPMSDSFICRREGIRKLARICHLSSQNIHRRMGNSTLPKFSRSSIPKTVYYREVNKIASHYKHILFLDEDIIINGEDLRKSLDFLSCGDFNGGSPLLAQIRIDLVGVSRPSQSSSVHGAEVFSISPKAVIFDSRFFVWLTMNVLESTRQYALSTGVDWGPSTVWVQAARDYASEVLRYGVNVPVCIEIVGGRSLMDMDLHTYRMKYDYPTEYEKSGNNSILKYREQFPSWAAEDMVKGVNGHPTSRLFRELISSCILNKTAGKKRQPNRNN
jgi:hypothetical protein